MIKFFAIVLMMARLSSCRPSASNELGGPVEIAQASRATYESAETKAAALSVVTERLAGAQKLQFYRLDSAQVSDQGRYWRVLAPRVDSVSRMLIQMDVDKVTGYMSSTRVNYRVLNQ